MRTKWIKRNLDILSTVNFPVIDLAENDVLLGSSLSVQINAIVAAANNFSSGRQQVSTFTFDTFENTDDGDYIVIPDLLGNLWAAAADKTGSSPEPTGAIWQSIPANRKVMVDVSGATTAADIAALFETALNGLSDVPFSSADSTADVAVTMTDRGVAGAASVHNADDSGAGTISVDPTTAGLNIQVDLENSEMIVPNHTLIQGQIVQLTTTGTLPDPLLTSTDYYVIKINNDRFALASSAENAALGEKIELVDIGSNGAANTATPASISGASVTLQESNDGVNFSNVASATNITVSASIFIKEKNPALRFYRLAFAISAGGFSAETITFAKNNDD